MNLVVIVDVNFLLSIRERTQKIKVFPGFLPLLLVPLSRGGLVGDASCSVLTFALSSSVFSRHSLLLWQFAKNTLQVHY